MVGSKFFALDAGFPNKNLRGSAVISPDAMYRYTLTRDWNQVDHPIQRVCFVMLNPSTADATKPDPTMTRCVNYAKSWGYPGLVIVNLFALRATKPACLLEAAEPVGPENDTHVADEVGSAGLVVCAWGAKGTLRGRDAEVMRVIRAVARPHCLRLTKGGHPEHPLYLPARLGPIEMPEVNRD